MPEKSQKDSRPAILHLVHRLDGSGAHRLALHLASRVVAEGGRAFLAYDEPSPTSYEVTRSRVIAISEKIGRRHFFASRGAVRRMSAMAAKEGIDIVHAHGASLSPVGRKIATAIGGKLVTTFHNGPGSWENLRRKTRHAIAASDHIFCQSSITAKRLATILPGMQDKISLTPYGVDLNIFDPYRNTAERVIALSRTWRIPEDKPVILMPARYARQKGHVLLLRALRHLRDHMRDRDFRCIILGASDDEGAYRHRLEKMTEKMRLADRVLLAEECRDMPAAYMLADVVVAPYLTPSIDNRVILEAQAMGRPVIATDFPMAREALEGNKMSWIVPPQDVTALAQAIDEALAIPLAERQNLMPATIDSIRQWSNLEIMSNIALDLYWALLHPAPITPA